MSKQYDSEGFMSTPLEGAGARPQDDYRQDSEDNEVRFREADEEYQRLKADFARIARAKRMTSHSRSDSTRSSSPLSRQSQRRATNLPKFRIATFYASDVELWFNQMETQFALHQINDEAFIRQMPASIRAHLATQPDSATLESLAVLADRALAAEEDVEESKPGVAEIKVEETTKLVGLLEDLSRRIKKLETVTTSERKRNKGRGRANINYAPAPAFAPNVQASGFVSNQPSQYRNEQDNARPFVPPTNLQPLARPFIPPPNPQRNDAAKTLDSANAPVCYFHQTFGDKARTCRSPCAFSLNC